MAAYRELVGSDKPVQLRPWLYTIARNRCLTLLRTRQRQADEELVEPPTEHLAAEVERRHDLRYLLRDVAAQPERLAEWRRAIVSAKTMAAHAEEIEGIYREVARGVRCGS
jgi:DNA-directed RNA polymerase specialized sigma24 family protein